MIYFYGYYYRRTPDGVGKTTICKELCQQLPLTYTKESYTGDNKEKETRIRLMLTRILDKKETFLYDRTTLIDDFVYNFLNESQSSIEQYKDIVMALLSHCRIFHLQLDEQIRRQRFEQRGDEYITNDMMGDVAIAYQKFYQNLHNVETIKLSGVLSKDVKKLVRRIKNDKDNANSSK